MITADPNTLRYGANRFAAAAQEMKRQAIELEQTASNTRQGQDGWSGKGSQAFMMRGERLVRDVNKASQAFESVANTLSRFAMRMEYVLELRRRADRLDQQAFEYGDETLDSIHARQHLRHQAAQLRHQADSEASVADSQASNEFQVIAQMVPATLIPGADANANLLEGLPKHWQDYYRRHPELLQEEKGATPMTMGSYKRADYDQIDRRDDAMAALIEYHKLTQSPWLSDEDREEAARVYCEQAYSKLTADELEKEIGLILKEEAQAQKWKSQIQSGVYGEELIEQEGYLGYAFKEYYKDGALAAGMAGVLAGMGKFKKTSQNDDRVESPSIPVGLPKPPTKVNYGDQYTKEGRIKILKPDVEYTSNEGYNYKTDSQGRVSNCEGSLQLGDGKRNNHAQKVVGREDRLPDDDGGHLIATIFKGSGDLDNLVPMNGNLNKGEWKKLENTWSDALKQGDEVKVKITPNYQGDSKRPDSFTIKFKIGEEDWELRRFDNAPGGKKK